MPDIATDKIEQARIKLARAKARLQMLEARARKATRARQTRRKVILGGLLGVTSRFVRQTTHFRT